MSFTPWLLLLTDPYCSPLGIPACAHVAPECQLVMGSGVYQLMVGMHPQKRVELQPSIPLVMCR